MSEIGARAVPGLGEIEAGCDLAAAICDAAAGAGMVAGAATVVCVAHKAVSKAEGSVVVLDTVVPSREAIVLTGRLRRSDPRIVQVVLDQAQEVVRSRDGVLICRTPHGFVCANAGIDVSNALPGTVVLLPRDPDGSARALRARLHELTGAWPAVVISDSFGRAWRNGQCDVALGCAGLAPLDDWRGRHDSNGRELHATCLAVADQAAATADLVRGKDTREPVVFVTGLQRHITRDDGPGAAELVRAAARDLFR